MESIEENLAQKNLFLIYSKEKKEFSKEVAQFCLKAIEIMKQSTWESNTEFKLSSLLNVSSIFTCFFKILFIKIRLD